MPLSVRVQRVIDHYDIPEGFIPLVEWAKKEDVSHAQAVSLVNFRKIPFHRIGGIYFLPANYSFKRTGEKRYEVICSNT